MLAKTGYNIMENKYLDEVLPFLQKIPKERREKFYTYFQNAPLWLLDSFQVENMQIGRAHV